MVEVEVVLVKSFHDGRHVNDVRYVTRKHVFPLLEKIKSATLQRNEPPLFTKKLILFIYEKVETVYLRKCKGSLYKYLIYSSFGV